MLAEKYFFEIAVYRNSEDEFNSDLEKARKKHKERLSSELGILPETETYKRSVEAFTGQYGSWRYNQVIGWIRLYSLGTQIRGEYWFVKAKRIHRNMKDRYFFNHGKAFEINLSQHDSSEEIFLQVSNQLENLKQEKPFKGRHIDLEAFLTAGVYMNWRRLLGFKYP